jgi:hypothetical protein
MTIASFTQTYGTSRISEIELLKHDKVGNEFRNKCDKIIFAFHNCPKNIIDNSIKILEMLYPVDKLKILIYNNISYRDTLLKTIDFFKINNIEYMLLIQDDQFGINNEYNLENLKNVDSIFQFINCRKPYYFNILLNHGDKNINKVNTIEEIKIDNVEFYNYRTNTFNYVYSYNDGTHFITIDFLENLLLKCSSSDVWNLENERNNLFKMNSYERWGMNKVMFNHLSIHGKNIMDRKDISNEIDSIFSGIQDWNKTKEYIMSII